MSAEAVGWVYKFSPYTGAKFAAHLAIADTASDVHGYEFWMALGKLGRKARLGRRAVQYAVQEMVDDGLLELVNKSNGGRNRPSRYRMVMPAVQPQFYEPTAPEGDPFLLCTPCTVGGETVHTTTETVHTATQTVHGVHGHRTQGNPNEPLGRLPVKCAHLTCPERFADMDAMQDHYEGCAYGDLTPAADLKVVS